MICLHACLWLLCLFSFWASCWALICHWLPRYVFLEKTSKGELVAKLYYLEVSYLVIQKIILFKCRNIYFLQPDSKQISKTWISGTWNDASSKQANTFKIGTYILDGRNNTVFFPQGNHFYLHAKNLGSHNMNDQRPITRPLLWDPPRQKHIGQSQSSNHSHWKTEVTCDSLESRINQN